LTAEILVTGAVDDGVSLERFLGQNEGERRRAARKSVVGTSGAHVSFSPRFGVETEPMLDRVATRFGSYYEPHRFVPTATAQNPTPTARAGRQHFTFGADLKLFPTRWFGLLPDPIFYKLQASVDIAPRYESLSLGIGVWH
jgi:hypothetical protein